MTKPHGMSRKDYRNMREVVREFLNDPSAMVDFSQESASGFKSERHDEGFSSRFVEVYFSEKTGQYLARVESWGKDCDGRHSTSDDFTVGRNSRRRRYYMSRNHETNRPSGKFGVSGWKVLNKGRSSQRDFTAEAAGY